MFYKKLKTQDPQNHTLFSGTSVFRAGEAGGGVSLIKPYRYVLLQRVWFSSGFGLKTGIDFAHFGLESGMVFERRTYSIPNEEERELSDFEMDVNKKIAPSAIETCFVLF